MKQNLLTRGILTLTATAVCSTALALLIHDRGLAPPPRTEIAQHLALTAPGPNSLVEAHLESVQSRYAAISTTPQFRANLEVDHAPTLAHYAAELQRRQGASRIVFLDSMGRIKTSAGDPSLDPPPGPKSGSIVTPSGQLYATARVPLATGDRLLGELCAIEPIGVPTRTRWIAAESAALSRARWSLLGGGMSALCAALVASLFLSRALVGPLREVQEAARRIGSGDFTARVGSERRDEIGQLAHSVDEMADRLQEHDHHLTSTVATRTRGLRQATEEAVAAARAAEEANRAKSEFLARMSHEIRTPMNGVLGMLELLSVGELDANQAGFVETAQLSADGLLAIIDDILDLSKIEAGKLLLASEPLEIGSVVEETLSFLRGLAESKGLDLTGQVAPTACGTFRGDPVRLRQLLINLVGNAIKFTSVGGVAVHVTAAPRSGESQRLTFEVSDSGIGIPRKIQSSIFEEFCQADESTTRSYGGTGLGLTISKQLVELMGGTIEVESQPGVGSTFRFEVPLEPAAAGLRADSPAPPGGGTLADDLDLARDREAGTTALSATPARGALRRRSAPLEPLGVRVLVAEDNHTNRMVVIAMLDRLGCEFDLVVNGEEAVEAALAAEKSGRPYDAVLMDWHMPRLNGLEATRAIRAAEDDAGNGSPEARLPIIGLTASAALGDRERCLDAGMDDYLSKPFRRDALRRILELRARRSHSPPVDGSEFPAPLDPKALATLRELEAEGSEDLLNRVVTAYLQEAPQHVERLREAVAEEDPRSLRDAAHALKSASHNLGANRLAELCRDLEEVGRAGSTKDGQPIFVHAETEFGRVRQALLREQKEGSE